MRNILGALCLAGFLTTAATADDNELDITPVYQEFPVWCWIAVGEMIFRHYELPNINPGNDYQCGVVGIIALHGMLPPICNVACQQCPVPAETSSRVSQMIELYSQVLNAEGAYPHRIRASHEYDSLSRSEIVDNIDDGNPVVAGISPSAPGRQATAAHVVLIVGYEDDGDTLIVNDPYPYGEVGAPNPYDDAGADEIQNWQYAIDFDVFEEDLNWSESFTVKKVRGSSSARSGNHSGPSLPNFCCTQGGRFGPFPNPGIPPGGPCYAGPFSGQACY